MRIWSESQGPEVGRRDGPHERPGSGFCEPAEALYSTGDLTMTTSRKTLAAEYQGKSPFQGVPGAS